MSYPLVALLAEGVDRNLCVGAILPFCCLSPSSRRAWIEICQGVGSWASSFVALLAEGVDRNRTEGSHHQPRAGVALLAEGVDRNMYYLQYYFPSPFVALLAEGVDRNSSLMASKPLRTGSPSSRRAWIEIAMKKLEESGQMSPSSRRAWIEMAYRGLWGRKT